MILSSATARAWKFAHRLGVTHREHEGRRTSCTTGRDQNVKITDFGARADCERGRRRQISSIGLRPAYMSPEAGEGAAGSTTAPTSIRSGWCCNHLLTVDLPFPGGEQLQPGSTTRSPTPARGRPSSLAARPAGQRIDGHRGCAPWRRLSASSKRSTRGGGLFFQRPGAAVPRRAAPVARARRRSSPTPIRFEMLRGPFLLPRTSSPMPSYGKWRISRTWRHADARPDADEGGEPGGGFLIPCRKVKSR